MPAESFGAYCERLIGQQRRDTRETVSKAARYAIDASPTHSGRAQAIKWMEAHPNGALFSELVFLPKLEHGARLLEAIDQHAQGLQSMIPAEPILSVPMMTVYRAMFEATAQLCNLFDASIVPEKIAARAVAAQIDALQGTERVGALFHGNDKAIKRAESAREGLKAIMRFFTAEAAIEFTTASRGDFPHHAVTVKVGAHRENVKFNATHAIRLHIGEDWHYELGSGVAHSRPWALPSFVDGFDDPPEDRRDFDTLVVITGGVLLCADAVHKALEGETGYDTKPARKQTLLRRKGLLSFGRNEAPSLIGLDDYESRPGNYRGQNYPDDYAAAFRVN